MQPQPWWGWPVVSLGVGSANTLELDNQTAPFARRAAVPTGVDLVSFSAGVGTTSATCTVCLRSTLGY